MNCPNCSATNQTSGFCTECGQSLSSSTPVVSKAAPVASRGMVITGFVLSLVGLIVLAVPFGIASTVISAIARSRGARGMATAGLVIGIIDIVLGFVMIAFGRVF